MFVVMSALAGQMCKRISTAVRLTILVSHQVRTEGRGADIHTISEPTQSANYLINSFLVFSIRTSPSTVDPRYYKFTVALDIESDPRRFLIPKNLILWGRRLGVSGLVRGCPHPPRAPCKDKAQQHSTMQTARQTRRRPQTSRKLL